jgi:cysteinyl-tRNA synthetase
MIRLYDTLAREKRAFEPAHPERITMYVCGPTVYGRAHIGNARPAVVFDTLARLIRHEFGENSLVYARNVTDVDDKIIAAAESEGVGYRQITERYYRHYMEDMGALNVLPPDFEPRATAFVPRMIGMIERLIETGNAYEAEGHVIFSVPSDPDYGELSRRDREAILSGARVEVAPYKRDPADFVLWKPAGESAEQVALSFPSPWGPGRPGWHIECSAMIEAFGSRQDARYVETIDIHGGGLDLIFPHHENEIAQSRCAHGGAPLARFWVHNGFVDMGAEKMSKSLGNIVTPAELLAKGHRGETLRLALLSAHYRSPLPWTEALVEQSKTIVDRLYRAAGEGPEGEADEAVLDALRDDLNTPLALSRLAQLEGETLKASARLLGLLEGSPADWFQGDADAPAIEARIAERAAAKKNRDFATADRIRDELKAEGIVLEDGPGGTTWRRE